MVAMQDETTQRHGWVCVWYKVGKQYGMNPRREVLWKGCQISQKMPLAMAIAHFCFSKQVLPFVWMFKMAVEKLVRDRVKVHEGTKMPLLQQSVSRASQVYMSRAVGS